MILEQSITQLPGVGPKMAKTLEKLHIHTIRDLIFHLPYRYQDRTRLMPIEALRIGDTAIVEARVVKKELSQGKRKYLTVWIKDGTGLMMLKFFNFNHGMLKTFDDDGLIRAFGEVKKGYPYLEMVHPEFKALHENIPVEERLTPIYPLTAGLTQKQIRTIVASAMKLITPDSFPSFVSQKYSLSEALHYLHNPPPDADLFLLSEGLHPWQKALALEEILAYQLAMNRAREQESHKQSIPIELSFSAEKSLLSSLPYQLTNAQNRVIAEIKEDLMLDKPMMRLVQGDVGSGKTIVATVALLHVAMMKQQAIMIAPTELLAEQHYITISKLLTPLGISVTFLSGGLTAKEKRIRGEAIKKGEAQVIVGTHATFQESVEYSSLALVIVDEQHRFGVEQRLALQEKNQLQQPHFLMMTATPIPRTLAMIAYADLKHSIIDEKPANRIPITTTLVNHQKRDQLISRLALQCAEGVQAYWVCTLIESNETLTAQAAEESHRLLEESLPDLRIGLLHGKMKPKDKEYIMQSFKNHELDVLVATTVIEVGVDVPNASIMIIENAERLGLFQLHQLRGRVGRGSKASFCLLMYEAPLSQVAQERLRILQQTEDGFVIAEKDLELRGTGEIIGTKQTGEVTFKVANIFQHKEIIEKAQKMVPKLLDNDEVVNGLIERWLNHRTQFIHV